MKRRSLVPDADGGAVSAPNKKPRQQDSFQDVLTGDEVRAIWSVCLGDLRLCIIPHLLYSGGFHRSACSMQHHTAVVLSLCSCSDQRSHCVVVVACRRALHHQLTSADRRVPINRWQKTVQTSSCISIRRRLQQQQQQELATHQSRCQLLQMHTAQGPAPTALMLLLLLFQPQLALGAQSHKTCLHQLPLRA